MARVKVRRSIGAELNITMLGLVFFTALVVFVVSGFAWATYLEQLRTLNSEALAARFQIPVDQVSSLLLQTAARAERSTNFGNFNDLVQLLLFASALLIALPTLLTWWFARRFSQPLTQLSESAHRMAAGDFSARVKLNRALERRSDETALLLKDFNAMAASLERLEGERRYTVAAIAHELRTPVTVLRGRLEGVRDGVIAGDAREFQKLIGHADLLTTLIEDLQLLSLADAGQLQLERTDFVVQDLLKRLHTDFLVKSEKQQIRLQLVLPLEALHLNGDQQRLYQVFSNLLSNALRHTAAHGSIELRLTAGRTTLTLEIQDSGAGFTPEALSRAFERFYRSPDRGRQRGGSGLGLAISKSLIEAHGGRIELLNTSSGAYVRVTLHLASSQNLG